MAGSAATSRDLHVDSTPRPVRRPLRHRHACTSTRRAHAYWATVERRRRSPEATDPRLSERGPGGPVFFEVKRRVGDRSSRPAARSAATGPRARRTDPRCSPSSREEAPGYRQLPAHYRYRAMCRPRWSATSASRTSSLVDDYARVTFDREPLVPACHRALARPAHDRWTYVDGAAPARPGAATSAVLLELKFTSLVPDWMRRMVHPSICSGLAFCKYTRAVDSMRLVPDRRIARGGLRW